MVHQYQLLNQNIVLDTCSGGVYSVDKMAYDMISIFERKDKELWTNQGAGERLHFRQFDTAFEEAEYIAFDILKTNSTTHRP